MMDKPLDCGVYAGGNEVDIQPVEPGKATWALLRPVFVALASMPILGIEVSVENRGFACQFPSQPPLRSRKRASVSWPRQELMRMSSVQELPSLARRLDILDALAADSGRSSPLPLVLQIQSETGIDLIGWVLSVTRGREVYFANSAEPGPPCVAIWIDNPDAPRSDLIVSGPEAVSAK